MGGELQCRIKKKALLYSGTGCLRNISAQHAHLAQDGAPISDPGISTFIRKLLHFWTVSYLRQAQSPNLLLQAITQPLNRIGPICYKALNTTLWLLNVPSKECSGISKTLNAESHQCLRFHCVNFGIEWRPLPIMHTSWKRTSIRRYICLLFNFTYTAPLSMVPHFPHGTTLIFFCFLYYPSFHTLSVLHKAFSIYSAFSPHNTNLFLHCLRVQSLSHTYLISFFFPNTREK